MWSKKIEIFEKNIKGKKLESYLNFLYHYGLMMFEKNIGCKKLEHKNWEIKNGQTNWRRKLKYLGNKILATNK